MGMNLTEREVKNKNLLSEKKPIAFNKIKTFSQRVKEEKSIALIQLQISYQCPLKCKHCAVEKFKQHIKEDMSIENIKKIADEAHEYGISAICISGGEPLAFPNLNEIIDAIGPDRFVLSMDTNGLYLTATGTTFSSIDNSITQIGRTNPFTVLQTGEKITISGTINNNGTFTVLTTGDTTITVSESLDDETSTNTVIRNEINVNLSLFSELT